MKINIYSVMLDGKRLPYLRLDRSVDYKRQSKLNEPGLMARMINEIFELEDCAEEHLIMVALDTKLKVLGIFQTAHGSLTTTEVSVRGILQRAMFFSIECGARCGEICSLKWEDVKEDYIHIHSQQLKNKGENGSDE